MKILNNKYNDLKGVSPVIGIILVVAVTVGLVALASLLVFDLGEGASETADATVSVSEKSDTIEFKVIRNENIESLRIQTPTGDEVEFDSDIGNIENIELGNGEYRVIAVLDDGNEEVIRQISISGEAELSGDFDVDDPVVEE